MKRIKIVMANKEDYLKDDNTYNSTFWHILASNCHKYPWWIETAIKHCQKYNKDLMIGVFKS